LPLIARLESRRVVEDEFGVGPEGERSTDIVDPSLI